MRRRHFREPTIRGHGVGARWLIWLAVGLLLMDAAAFAVTGRELIVTGPETETLGQGAVGFMLIFGAFWLAVAALLGSFFPLTVGLIVLVLGLVLYGCVAGIDYEHYYSGDSWYVGEQGWSDYWLAGDRVRDPSGLGGVVIDSRTLSLALFLVPLISAILLLVSGFLRSRSLGGETPLAPPSPGLKRG